MVSDTGGLFSCLKEVVKMGRKNRREEIYIKPLPTVEQLPKRKMYERDPDPQPKRMEIWFANLEFRFSSNIQGGRRPVLIVSNDINNARSNTVTVLPMTSKMKRPEMPTHTWIDKEAVIGMEKGSMILAEQITTIDKSCLERRLGICEDPTTVKKIEATITEQVFTKK